MDDLKNGQVYDFSDYSNMPDGHNQEDKIFAARHALDEEKKRNPIDSLKFQAALGEYKEQLEKVTISQMGRAAVNLYNQVKGTKISQELDSLMREMNGASPKDTKSFNALLEKIEKLISYS